MCFLLASPFMTEEGRVWGEGTTSRTENLKTGKYEKGPAFLCCFKKLPVTQLLWSNQQLLIRSTEWCHMMTLKMHVRGAVVGYQACNNTRRVGTIESTAWCQTVLQVSDRELFSSDSRNVFQRTTRPQPLKPSINTDTPWKNPVSTTNPFVSHLKISFVFPSRCNSTRQQGEMFGGSAASICV